MNKVLVRKCKGKRLQRILQRRWEDIIKMDLTQVEWGCMDWIHLAEHGDSGESL